MADVIQALAGDTEAFSTISHFPHSLPVFIGSVAPEVTNRLPNYSARAPPFVLSTQQEHILLDATDASLKAIVEQLGRELDIRVDA